MDGGDIAGLLAVLVFAVPASPLAQPWSTMIGTAVAAAIAVPPFAGWWTQRAQIGEVQAQVREERDRTNELKAQREPQDPCQK